MGNYKMNESKKSLILGIAATSLLTISMAANIYTTKQETVATQQLAQQVNRMAMLTKQNASVTMKSANQIMNTMKKMNSVTESFEITSIDDAGYVRGEQPTGGEGIYYHQDFFAEHVGSVSVGDEIEITWPVTAYDEGDWETVSNVSKIVYK
jgi:hypothetical protein